MMVYLKAGWLFTDISAAETAKRLPELSVAIERAGFDGIAVTDHPFPPGRWIRDTDDYSLDPFVALSIAASHTRSLRLLVWIAVAGYRHPLLVAKAAGSLQVLSNGRLILGAGAGYLQEEFEALGADFSARGSALDSLLEVLPQVVRGGVVDVDAEGLTVRGHSMFPSSFQLPSLPVWVGGNSTRAVQRAAARADGWMPFAASAPAADRAGTARLDSIEILADRIQYAQALRAQGRPNAPLRICFSPLGGGVAAKYDIETLAQEATEMQAAGVTDLVIELNAATIDGCERELAELANVLSAVRQ